ncbi:hypothetical protein STEG23_021923, partial [Scotinomys teguina]
MWSKRNTPPLLVGMQIGTTTLESSMANSQKIGNHSSYRPSHTTLGHIPKECQSYHKDTCSTMFIAALFVIARTWKQPRCPSTEEWIRKMWYIYTMEYYAAEKNNDIMKFAGKWMELENVILSEDEFNLKKFVARGSSFKEFEVYKTFSKEHRGFYSKADKAINNRVWSHMKVNTESEIV